MLLNTQLTWVLIAASAQAQGEPARIRSHGPHAREVRRPLRGRGGPRRRVHASGAAGGRASDACSTSVKRTASSCLRRLIVAAAGATRLPPADSLMGGGRF